MRDHPITLAALIAGAVITLIGVFMWAGRGPHWLLSALLFSSSLSLLPSLADYLVRMNV
jgi:hypothetical membrane protein